MTIPASADGYDGTFLRLLFDDLYLVFDQQCRWKSEILQDPAPRALDPLLIGEIKEAHTSKVFVIHQFDVTEAEQYLADEFAVKAA
jgi:hypothetical protein